MYLRIAIVGDESVGKTSLINNKKQNKPTTIVDYINQKFIFNDIVNVCFIDTSGNKKYENLVYSSINNVNGYIIVFDLSNPISFENAKKKYYRFKNNPIVLIGNKYDIADYSLVPKVLEFVEKEKIKYFKCSIISNNFHLITREFVRDITKNINNKINNQFKDFNYDEEPYNYCDICKNCTIM